MKPSLQAAYQAAHYRMLLPCGELIWQIGVAQPRARSRLRSAGCRRRWHILTPCNPHSRRLPAGANRYRLRCLHMQLLRKGWTFYPALNSAADGSWPEAAVVIFDAPRAALLVLARRYGQNAVVVARLGEAPALQALKR